MKIITGITIFFLLVLLGCGTVQFKPMALYDVYEEPPEFAKIEPIIYTDAVGTMWNSLEDCGQFEITKETAYSGNSSIKLSWNKADCVWIGFGNSFNNWRASDMSQERFNKALSFYARTQEGVNSAIPIVAAMEDFGGGGTYHFIDAGKYLYGLELDTTWKRIIVPLWHFPIFEEEVDIRSIQQMKFQLEGAGSYFLDDLRLIDYSEEQYEKMRAEVELMKPKGDADQIIYTEGSFNQDAWGYESNRCQTLAEINDAGNTCIKWEYTAEECPWAKWGINWNNWYAINFRGITEASAISLRIKASEEAKFRVSLRDYRYHVTEFLNSKDLKFRNNWEEVVIPLRDLDLSGKKFALDQIKQLEFEGIASGTVHIDDIKVITLQ